MNEGRYHSPLARKVLQHFDLQRGAKHDGEDGSTTAAAATATAAVASNSSGAPPCDEVTVVKFISRSYFDQTKGADLLRRLARQDTYDSTLVEEYILLSSSHAVLHYTQLTLGAVSFTKHCLDVRVNTGGHNNHRMEIDRSTLLQLELLTNNGAKSSSNRKHSLISTMDCTKTSVGHRLLRTTLMAPPCRMDTITARLDLVDTFLLDEDLFYATLQQLKNLTSLDNMLTNIVVVPARRQQQQQQQQRRRTHSNNNNNNNNNNNTNTLVQVAATTTTTTATTNNSTTATGKNIVGKSNAANARVASKGISALVCIKSTLASIPVLASILRNHLDRIDAINEEGKQRRKNAHKEEEEEKEKNDDEGGGEAASIATAKNSLLIGLGVGVSSSSSTSSSTSSSRTNNHQLLRAIIFALSQPELRIVRDAIDEAFTESTTYTKNANAMKHQECFALKSSDGNGMMDILRKVRTMTHNIYVAGNLLFKKLTQFLTHLYFIIVAGGLLLLLHLFLCLISLQSWGGKAFLSNVDDIYKKADDYAEVHGISHVAVKFSTARGYYLSLPMEMASNLPNEFIQPTKSGKFIHCSTEEVQSLNIRAQDNIQDLLMMTHERIQQVLDVARSKYDALARLSDAVALLDLCHSFADKVTLSKLPWARPSLTDGAVAAVEENQKENHDMDNDDNDEGGNTATATATATTNLEESYAIAICNGRYGIDVDDSVVSSGDGEWVANDTYANLTKNLTIISGINGSGKSTYLKQIAIIVLLAHCGSYVPAEEALIPLTNRLCARMMTADDQENNISSFMLEMKETAFICNNATSRSLILLDELGRATSNEDGVAIAWAVAECLLAKGALTYFVTHYPQLCQMSSAYPAVQNQHLKATMSDDGNGIIEYSHKIGTGPCDAMSSYGVEMATSCGWPSDVVEEVRYF
jgi:DNA mismatch repair ATPase MutS